jgi:NADPH:quinone reductase
MLTRRFLPGYDTAYHCLVTCGQVAKGEWILVHGATGGVGIPAVRMAKLLGATVVATTRSAGKVDFLKKIGADHVVVVEDSPALLLDGAPHQLPAWVKEVKELTPGKRGVDVVYDGVGSDPITVPSMRALQFGGRLLIVGWAATPNVARGAGQRGSPNVNKIPTNLIMMKSLRVIGCPAMIALRHNPELQSERVEKITEWVISGALPPPVVAETFPLSDVRGALMTRVASGSTAGSTVVLIGDEDATSSKL